MLFSSQSIVIIMFAHIFEDLCGIVCSPFWLLKDVFMHNMDPWKIVDYSIYFLLVVFIAVGVVFLIIT